MILSSGDSNTRCRASDSSIVPRFAPMWPPVTALLSMRNCRILPASSSSSANEADRTRAGVRLARSAASVSFAVIMLFIVVYVVSGFSRTWSSARDVTEHSRMSRLGDARSRRLSRDDEDVAPDPELREAAIHVLLEPTLSRAGNRELEGFSLRVARASERIVADVHISHQEKHVDRKRRLDRYDLEAFDQQALNGVDVEIVHMMRRRNPPRTDAARIAQRRLKRAVVVRHHQRDETAWIQHAVHEREQAARIGHVLEHLVHVHDVKAAERRRRARIQKPLRDL